MWLRHIEERDSQGVLAEPTASATGDERRAKGNGDNGQDDDRGKVTGDEARRFRASVDGKKVAIVRGLWEDEEREAYAERLFSRYADADVSFQTRLACIDKAGAPTSGSSFSSPENAPHSVMTMGVATLGDFVEQCFQSSHEESHFLLDEDILSDLQCPCEVRYSVNLT